MSARRRCRLGIERLEARDVPALNPTGMEQEMLELLNRMRLFPAQELSLLVDQFNPIRSPDPEVTSALRYFNVSSTDLQEQWSELTAVPPLAWNEKLVNAALAHNLVMIAQDKQEHQLPGEASLGTRITNAGYSYNYVGENIFAYAESVFYGHAGFAIDWGWSDTGIQDPPGHRDNMMSANFREIGISIVPENNPITGVGPLVITQDFGRRFNMGNPYLLGVVFNDQNSDGFYQAGEGLGGVTVQVAGPGNFSTTTMDAGGWQLQAPAGTYTVTFSGGGLGEPIVKEIVVGTQNVKLDAKVGESSGGLNHAPVLNTAGSPMLPTIDEDTVDPAGTTIDVLIGAAISDVDADALQGVAITGVTGTAGGDWEYSLDDGTSWNSLNSTAANAARLLRAIDLVRYRPNSNFNGQATMLVRAWDQTAGAAGDVVNLSAASSTGGSTAFSSAMETTAITVAAVNDAPVLDASQTPVLVATPQDSATPPPTTVAALLGGVSDPDGASALRGIAIVGITGSDHGVWQFSSNGSTWFDLGPVASDSARLLADTARLRFKPNLDYSGIVELVFRAWDRSSGATGELANISATGGTSAFSDAQDVATLSVFPVNRAPVLDTAPAPLFTPVRTGEVNPPGDTVASLLGAAVTDGDPGALQGMAVTALSNATKGTWQYSLNGGVTWLSFGVVSAKLARLLRSEDRIRFVPGAGFGGSATLTFRAWDQTSGVAGGTANLSSSSAYGGTTAFSILTDLATVVVNIAPTLNNAGAPTLLKTPEDSVKPPSTKISTFLAKIVADSNKGALKGIAVTDASGAGTWQFSANNSTWTELGAVSASAARLLPDSYRLRFLPSLNFNGMATLTFQAWDRTSGVAAGFGDPSVNGGVSAFSVDAETVSLLVTPVNDAPVLQNAGDPTLTPVAINSTAPQGDLVGNVFGSLISDVDPGALQGIAVTALSGTATGTWQYSLDGGTTWRNFGAVSAAAARLLRASDRIRYVPVAGFTGTAAVSFRAWDQTKGLPGGTAKLTSATTIGGVTAFSAALETAVVVVG